MKMRVSYGGPVRAGFCTREHYHLWLCIGERVGICNEAFTRRGGPRCEAGFLQNEGNVGGFR